MFVLCILAMAFTVYVERVTQCQARFAGVKAYSELKGGIFDSMTPSLIWAGLFIMRFTVRRNRPFADWPSPVAYTMLFIMAGVLLVSPVLTFYFTHHFMRACKYTLLPF